MEMIKYSGNYMKVTEEIIDGNNWERCYLRDGVIIYALDSDGKYILIQEKRPHEIEKVRLRFPAGHLEEGITVLENANKELREELGLRANELKEFFKIQTSGTVNNTVHFVLAKDFAEDPLPNPDGDVILSVERYTKEEILELIMKDKLRWSTAVLGFLRLYHFNLS